MKKYIKVKTQFEGFHNWPNAPEEVSFLRDLHRHIFVVSAKIGVENSDRELEFFIVQKYMNQIIPSAKLGSNSCECIAEIFIEALELQYGERSIEVEVSEDGENSAIVRNRYR